MPIPIICGLNEFAIRSIDQQKLDLVTSSPNSFPRILYNSRLILPI